MPEEPWIEFIQRVAPVHKGEAYRLYPGGPPASPAILDEIETSLNVPLPAELRGLLEEMNGIRYKHGWIVLSAEYILKSNRSFRDAEDYPVLFMPFDCLLFCAEAGNGDLFAYRILAGKVRRDDIFVWDHEDDSRTWVAPSLRTFVEWWVTGQLSD